MTMSCSWFLFAPCVWRLTVSYVRMHKRKKTRTPREDAASRTHRQAASNDRQRVIR